MTSTTIQTTRNYSTKRLARELGIPRAELLETLRNNEVAMEWHAGTRSWRITRREDVDLAVLHYRLQAEDEAAEAEARPATTARRQRIRAAYLALEAEVDRAEAEQS